MYKLTCLLTLLLTAMNLVNAQSPVSLHVETNDSTTAIFENINPLSAGSENAQYFKFGNGPYAYTGAIKSIGNNTATARLGFFTFASASKSGLLERMSIMDNGRVGIGTNNPLYSFHVKSFDFGIARFERGPIGPYGATGIEIVSSPGENACGIRSILGTNMTLLLGVPGLIVMPSGNVGIFNPSAYPVPDFQTKLYVEGAEMPGGTVGFKGTTNVSHFNYSVSEDTYLRGGKTDSKVFINDASGGGVLISANGGFTGIGTASPFAKLHVKGPTSAWLQVMETPSNWWATAESSIANGTIPVLSYGFNGNLMSYIRSDNGAYVAVSDKNLKTNIHDLGGTLAKVLQLRPVYYQMKTAPDAPATIGLIAQEVQPLFPEAVAQVTAPILDGANGNAEVMGINYDAFGVIAIKAIQEQQAQIETLRQQVQKLEELVLLLQKGSSGGSKK